jgi:hypothetical protein
VHLVQLIQSQPPGKGTLDLFKEMGTYQVCFRRGTLAEGKRVELLPVLS